MNTALMIQMGCFQSFRLILTDIIIDDTLRYIMYLIF